MRRGFRARRYVVAAATVVLGLTGSGLAGCTRIHNPHGAGPTPGNGASVSTGFPIGLLLPEAGPTRYATFDRPMIEAELKQLCPKCTVTAQSADQDATKQAAQADALLTQGAKALILDAVDPTAAVGIVAAARARNVPVIAYDRLAAGPVSYYVSYDNRKVGQVQGQALLDRLTKGGVPLRGQVVMINGSAGDPTAAAVKAGAHAVLDGKVTIGAEYDTPGWSPQLAQQEMEQAIAKVGKANVIGVYAADDGTGSGAIAALHSAHIDPPPPVTGRDAELVALQRILLGSQAMTVYEPIRPEAEAAAQLAISAPTGQVPTDLDMVIVHSGPTATLSAGPTSTVDITAVLLAPVAVTAATIEDTVLKDGRYPVAELCTGDYAAACTKAGISRP